jgi:hypothetical protein
MFQIKKQSLAISPQLIRRQNLASVAENLAPKSLSCWQNLARPNQLLTDLIKRHISPQVCLQNNVFFSLKASIC